MDINYGQDAYGEYHEKIGGYDLRLYKAEPGDVITYYAVEGGWTSKERRATFIPCEWARHCHGNQPSGTQYGSYRVTLPNGKRASVPVYL